MRIQIQHADKPAEMREVESEEEAQQLADSGLTVLVAGRDGGYRQLAACAKQDALASKEKPAGKVAAAVKKVVEKIVPAKKTAKKK
jgi:hypothetical protein